MTNIVTDVKEVVVKLGAFERAVVAKRVAIVAVVTILVQLAVNYGVFGIDIQNNVLHWLNAALDAVAALVAISITQPAVTPLKDPRNDAGTALIPTSQVDAIVANAVSEATSLVRLADVNVPSQEVAAAPEDAPQGSVEVDDSDDETVVETLE